MAELLAAELMRTPGVRRFLDGMLDDLLARRNLLVLLPSGEDLPIWETLRQELWRRDFHVRDVYLPDLLGGRTPAAELGERLGVKWQSTHAPRTTENLVRTIAATDSPPDIIYLGGYEKLPEGERRVWEEFVLEWVYHQQVAGQERVPGCLCVVGPAAAFSSRLPRDSVRLSVRWWWGMPSSLELQLLCRIADVGNATELEFRWREFQLPALAGNDVALAEYLWDKVFLGVGELAEHLGAYGVQIRGWTKDRLLEWRAEELISCRQGVDIQQGLVPPEQWHALWKEGMLWWTPEYGVELHTAALVVMDRQEDLVHRIWRGQTPLLLPFIDRVRMTLCGYLSQRYGSDWAVRWSTPLDPADEAAARRSSLACPWGHVEYLLRRCDHFRAEKRWLNLVMWMRQVRNELAHYRSIPFGDYERLWSQFKQAQTLGLR